MRVRRQRVTLELLAQRQLVDLAGAGHWHGVDEPRRGEAISSPPCPS